MLAERRRRDDGQAHAHLERLLRERRKRQDTRAKSRYRGHEQAHETFTGMGADINVHDQWACESMGEIQDRTREHLGQSDKAISAYRRLLRNAIEQAGNGGKPLMVLDRETAARLTGPPAIDGIGPTDGWGTYWRNTDEKLRKASSWASGGE